MLCWWSVAPSGLLFCRNDERGLYPRLWSDSPSDLLVVGMLYVCAVCDLQPYQSNTAGEHGETFAASRVIYFLFCEGLRQLSSAFR